MKTVMYAILCYKCLQNVSLRRSTKNIQNAYLNRTHLTTLRTITLFGTMS